jgi:hypothetical protein
VAAAEAAGSAEEGARVTALREQYVAMLGAKDRALKAAQRKLEKMQAEAEALRGKVSVLSVNDRVSELEAFK